MRRHWEAVLIGSVVLASLTLCQAQFDYRPYSGKPNPRLRKEVHSGRLSMLFRAWTNDGSYEDWATSTLAAQGKRPPKPKPPEYDEGASLLAYTDWLCMYSAYSAMDRKPQTTWAEGVPGDGIGEIVIVRVDGRKPVRIWAGYGKSDRTFRDNNRPKRVRVYLLEGTRNEDRSTEHGQAITDIRVISSNEVSLRDLNGYQALAFSAKPTAAGRAEIFVAVEILSVYPGRRFKDTCICEIGN